MAQVRITVDGKLAYTTSQAAERHSLTPDAMRHAISRLKIAPAATLDRLPLYLASEINAAMKARPGKGANLRRDR